MLLSLFLFLLLRQTTLTKAGSGFVLLTVQGRSPSWWWSQGRQQKLEAVGHITPIVRKQRTVDACWCHAPFSTQRRIRFQPSGWSHLGGCVLKQPPPWAIPEAPFSRSFRYCRLTLTSYHTWAFEAVHHVPQTSLEFALYRCILASQPHYSCLWLLSAGIEDMGHHTQSQIIISQPIIQCVKIVD